MSSSAARRRLAFASLLLIGTVAMRHADDARHRAPAAVAIVVSLDAGYQAQLGEPSCLARCQDVVRAIRDTLRQLLTDFHGYAKWATDGAPADTLEIRWLNPDPPFVFNDAHVAFVIRGPSWKAPTDSTMALFEDFEARSARALSPTGWTPGAVRGEWAPKIRDIVNDPRVQSRVFFTLPLDATVEPRPNGQYRVRVSPVALGTGGLDTQAPRFNLHVNVKENVQDGWTAQGVLYLSGCIVEKPQQRHYDCTADSLQAGPRPIARAGLPGVRITPLSVHLASFQPVPLALRARTSSMFPQ